MKSIKDKVFGQDEAVDAVSRRIKSGKNGNIVLSGPYGSGKTLLANATAETTGSVLQVINLADNHYDRRTTWTLFSIPERYYGCDDQTTLVEKLKQSGRSVLVLDEIEKASPSLFARLMRDIHKGRLTDYKGNIVPLGGNVTVMMTTCLGSKEFKNLIRSNCPEYEAEDIIKDLDRGGGIVEMKPLDRKSLRKTLTAQTERTRAQVLKFQPGCTVVFSNNALKPLLDKNEQHPHGTRMLKRDFERAIVSPLAGVLYSHMLDQALRENDRVNIVVKGSGDRFRAVIEIPKAKRKGHAPKGQF